MRTSDREWNEIRVTALIEIAARVLEMAFPFLGRTRIAEPGEQAYCFRPRVRL